MVIIILISIIIIIIIIICFGRLWSGKWNPYHLKHCLKIPVTKERPVSSNFYVGTCVKFTFATKIENERSLVSVKVEPRSTLLLSSAVFTLALFYLRD